LPAELAQGPGADKAATALERVEHTADRTQALKVIGLLAPRRQQGVEVVDFLGELLKEDLADLVVDLVADGLKSSARANRRRRPLRRRGVTRSEEHTSELQSRENLVCRLLLEKKK